MPNENIKLYMASSKSTGTIPKVKQRNNNASSTERRSNLVSNNLGNGGGNGHESPECNRQHHSKNLPFYPTMDCTNQEQSNGLRQNGTHSSNSALSTPTNSHPPSRWNSSSLSKCENIAKFPDKKQIESKLCQIQEYLQVATTMRANMKRTDEQMQSVSIQSPNDSAHEGDDALDTEQLNAIIKDLVDSEDKLKTILNDIEQFSDNGSDPIETETIRHSKNQLEHKVDAATRDLQMLKEQENLLLHLQLNAENELREAKLAQAKLAKSAEAPEWFNDSSDAVSGGSSSRNIDFRELEDRTKVEQPEHFQNQIDHLSNHIQQMRDGNDNRTQLIQILDARDAQLQAQHSTLQGKLQELQTKKQQVDQLIVQLQTMNEPESEDDEMGCQVKKIVNMKEQLATLKDMLNLVQITDGSLDAQEHNGQQHLNDDIEENVNRLITKTDNLMMQQNRGVPHVENVENGRSNHSPAVSSNERHVKEKQVNKKSMNANERERIKIQAELRAKRQELEELMCKHKAANSNLNHDVSEKNSEIGNSLFAENTTNAWFPMDFNVFNTRQLEPQSSESDDECPEDDPNEYSEMNSSAELNTATLQPMPAFNYPTANYIRQRSAQEAAALGGARVEMPHSSNITLSPISPARSVRNTTPASRENASSSHRNQLQKQLELIKSVCDQVRDSISGRNNDNAEQVPMRVRNNLTPSPIYSEPRHYSPRPSCCNQVNGGSALNLVSYPEGSNLPPQISPNDSAAYNSVLTTNALQTQAFILNTLNQCCQMLWHQQKELSTLRHTVNVMQQDRCTSVYREDNSPICMQSHPCIYQPNPPHNANMPPHSNLNYLANNFRHPNAPKMNPVGGAASMPNLNGGHCSAHSSSASTTNMEHAACCNNMMPTNNSNASMPQHQNIIGEHQLNTTTNPNHFALHHNQNVPAPIWNGPALNNQVAPGNRANNYWDNFRSYSRQNLLSTKSNDGSQNLLNSERSNANVSERHRVLNHEPSSQPATSGLFLLKANSNRNESIAASTASVGNTPRRQSCRGATAEHASSSPERRAKPVNNDDAYALPVIGTAFSMETISTSGDQVVANPNPNNLNEWTSDPGVVASPKSKLFEELRENVYKEVASLISANEGRPHFLIQLFRDLQLISSDPMRHKALQSIQALITSSLAGAGGATGGVLRQNGTISDSDTVRPNEDYSIAEESSAEYELLAMHQHDASASASATASESNISDLTDNGPKDVLLTSIIWPILSKHGITGEDIADQENAEQFHEALATYLNVRSDEDEAYMDIAVGPPAKLQPIMFDLTSPYIDEDEMAEADQSRVVEEEDEGAVGGLLNILERSSSSEREHPQMATQLDEELSLLETEDESEQGLDQVPTRLGIQSVCLSPKST